MAKKRKVVMVGNIPVRKATAAEHRRIAALPSSFGRGIEGAAEMKPGTIRRLFQQAYDDRGVFELDENFWKAGKQIADQLGRKPKKKS